MLPNKCVIKDRGTIRQQNCQGHKKGCAGCVCVLFRYGSRSLFSCAACASRFSSSSILSSSPSRWGERAVSQTFRMKLAQVESQGKKPAGLTVTKLHFDRAHTLSQGESQFSVSQWKPQNCGNLPCLVISGCFGQAKQSSTTLLRYQVTLVLLGL